MLKRYWPTIPLAIFFALAVFFEWSSANAPRPIEHSAGDQQGANRSVNKEPSVFFVAGRWIDLHHDMIEASSAIGSAIFTVALFGANILLWLVTRTAANAAKEAADAAGLSANAITVVERAYVYPVIIVHGAIEPCIRAAIDSTEEEIPAGVTAEIDYKFKNFGKTPAILKEAFVAVGTAPVGALIGVSLIECVLAPMEETEPFTSKMQMGITRKQAQRILTYTGHVCFEGIVTFIDIWGKEYTTEFYFIWDKDIECMRLSSVETKIKQEAQ